MQVTDGRVAIVMSLRREEGMRYGAQIGGLALDRELS